MYQRKLSVGILVLSAAVCGCEKKDTNEATPPAPATTATVTPKASAKPEPPAVTASASAGQPEATPAAKADSTERFIEAQDVLLYRVVDKVGEHLATATNAFKGQDKTMTANALDLAAKALTNETAGMSPEVRASLQKPADELERVAKDIRGGKFDKKEFETAVTNAYAADIHGRWGEVVDTTWYAYYDQPQLHFDKAQQELAKDPKAAAIEVAKVASYVRMEMFRASGQSKDRLASAVKELDQMATELYTGKSVSKSQFENAYYDTADALSYYHYENFMRAYDKKENEIASREFHASVKHLELAVAHAGETADSDATKVVKDAKDLGDKLEHATEADAATIKKKAEAVTQLLDKLRKKHGSK